jgi:hypothetical protein
LVGGYATPNDSLPPTNPTTKEINMGKLKDLHLSEDVPPDAFDQYYIDISLVLDNNETAQLMMGTMCEQALDEAKKRSLSNAIAINIFAYKIQEFYIRSIDYVSRETAQNSVGNMLVQQMCYNIPLYVFDRIAKDFFTDYIKDSG